jgi:KDO2-lipid IV(A) lauroyltransferase
MWLAARLPWSVQRGLGAGLGALALRVAGARRRAAQVNLALCFPRLDEAERSALLHAAFRDLGIGLFEFARAWWGSVAPMRRTVRIEGLDAVNALRAQGRGVLLVSGHFMTLEMCGRLMCDHLPLAGMYRRHRSPVMEWAVMRGRLRYASAMFGNDELRGAMRHLKRGGILWYAPDQDMRGKDTVFAPFFGVPAATITATHQFARLTGCAVVPFFHRREGADYVLRLGAPLPDFPSADAADDSARVNAAIEAMVREAPSQYLWIHRRFKRRPPGMASPYR